MILKFLIFILIVYWIIRAALNLWKAALSDGPSTRGADQKFSDQEVRREINGMEYEQTWTVGQKQARQRRKEPVEDARFRDI